MCEFDENLDNLYSPSRWSKRFSVKEVIEKHIEFVSAASLNARTTIPNKLDIPYGESNEEKYDIFGTDLPSDSDIFIFIHGGYWQELNKNLSSYIVKPLYQNNIKVIVLGYTLCPKISLRNLTKQVKKGVAHIASTNPNSKIFIGGHSAGAHLISMCFCDPEPVPHKNIKIIFLISGMFNLEPLAKTSINKPLFLDEQEARNLSPMFQEFKYFLQNNVKVDIIVGENDSPSFIDQSKEFHAKLSKIGITSNLRVLDSVDHFDIVERLNHEDYELTKFILSEIKDSRER